MRTKEYDPKINRVSPYVVPKNTPQSPTGIFMDSMVRDAPAPSYLRNFKAFAYKVFKAAPLMYLAAPNPVTAAIAVASGIDTLLKVRNGDKVGLFEALLVVGSCVHGAAAQAIAYTNVGEGRVQSNATNNASLVDCDSDRALRTENTTVQNNYTYCDLQTGDIGHAPIGSFYNDTALVPTEPELLEHCQVALEACMGSSNTLSASAPFSSPVSTAAQTTLQVTSTPFVTPSSSLSEAANTTSLFGSTAGATSSVWPSTTRASSAVRTSSAYTQANGATLPEAASSVLRTVTPSVNGTSGVTSSAIGVSTTAFKTTSLPGAVSTSVSSGITPSASASVIGSASAMPATSAPPDHPEVLQPPSPGFVTTPLAYLAGGVLIGIGAGTVCATATMATYCYNKDTKNKVQPEPIARREQISYALQMISNPGALDTLEQETSASLQISRV